MRAMAFMRRNIGLACLATGILGASVIAGCAAPAPEPAHKTGARDTQTETRPEQLRWLNRVTWGATNSTATNLADMGTARFLDGQLHAAAHVALPPAVQAQIDAMRISQKPVDELVYELEQQRKDADAITDDDQKKAAQQAYQQALNGISREAATRSLLRDLYSPAQLQEQMTWFWMNHFNVHQYKANIRVLVGDYEENAIRVHALGHFRDLLGATVHHPAMLRYLDNEQNAAGHINENYARELMELHTLGVNGGYAQSDVQELARILTGVGVNMNANAKPPNLKPQLQGQYVHKGLFEFNPNRHDYGDKMFLGQPVKGRGLAEVDEALDRLAKNPATARFISRKLAVYFVADDPPLQLVERMAQTFLASNGDIAAVLHAMFASPEFTHSLGSKFKDPVHYVVSAVRLAYEDKPILNAGPMLNWLNRMGEPLFAHATPDGYPLTQSAWASSGQMTTRFEIAKAIGSGSAGLFKTDGPQPQETPAFPQLANALYYQAVQKSLSATTRQALEQANSPQEWNMFLLASPEFMNR
jgi:uncharacterized protein (DUF1800 family)